MRRVLLTAVFLLGLTLAPPALDAAVACPMCRAATETDSLLPRAYMYSILFMLAVPATVLTGFGIGFYRLSQKQRAEIERIHSPVDAGDPLDVPENDDGTE